MYKKMFQVQNALLIAIIIGIFNVIIGSCIGPTSISAKASGFTGFSSKIIVSTK
jgi:ABC-type dipeptide/oligopeptide/nickel transport system permease subunit